MTTSKRHSFITTPTDNIRQIVAEIPVQMMNETWYASTAKGPNNKSVRRRAGIVAIVLLLLLLSAVVPLVRFAHNVGYWTGLQTTIQRRDNKIRNLSIPTPESVEKKVPKLLHLIWLGPEPPTYVKEVIDFSTELANEQGFEVKFWDDKKVDRLISSAKYKRIRSQWDALKADTTRFDRGTRLADFARYVVIHSEGGIYLDADLVPCADLEDFIGPPGYASFPYPQWPDRISNGLFSASPGHPVLEKALQLLAKIENIDKTPILQAAGPRFLADTVASHTGGNIQNAMSNNRTETPAWPGASTMRSRKLWYYKPMYKLRFGKPDIQKQVHWIHLSYNTWYSAYQPSPCEKEEYAHLVRPFLEEICSGDFHNFDWRKCGQTVNIPKAAIGKVTNAGRFDQT